MLRNIRIVFTLGIVFLLSLVLFACNTSDEPPIDGGDQKFTVIWKNSDGTTLKTDTDVIAGSMPTYNGQTPTKASTEQYTYTFTGWNPQVSTVSGNQTYTAVFSETIRTYVITWKDHDGTTLGTTSVAYGLMPAYQLPSNTTDKVYIGWTPQVDSVTGDKIYTAVLAEPGQTYTAIFENHDGTNLLTLEDLDAGVTPNYTGETPTKPSTAQYEYVFKGWSPALGSIIADTTYTAQFDEIERSYPITFKDADGTTLETLTLTFGTTPSFNLPADTAEWDYTGWDKEISAVDGETTYTALRTKKSYTISFNTNGGSNIQAITLEYGASLSKPANPSKEGNAAFGWFFDSELSDEVEFPLVVTESLTLHIRWFNYDVYLDQLRNLFGILEADPLEYIPEAMQPGGILTDSANLSLDFTSFVNTSSIPTGYGEQWHMVQENLSEAKLFTNIFNTLDLITPTVITLFDAYLVNNLEDEVNFVTTTNNYQIVIVTEGDLMFFTASYTANLPVFGSQTVSITLFLNSEESLRSSRIQIGSAAKARFDVGEDFMRIVTDFGTVRKFFFEIENNDNTVEGRLYETLQIEGLGGTSAVAEFVIENNLVIVSGNKASGIIGFTNYITEAYTTSGEFLGYEIRESLSGVTYNTLWIPLINLNGITNIKVIKSESIQEKDSIYLNNQTSVFKTKNVGGLSLKTLSRRYDIELRKQHFYYEEADEIKSVMLETPMFFVQEEVYSSLVTDVKAENSYLTSFGIKVAANSNTVFSAYDNHLPGYIENLPSYTPQIINDYLSI